MFFFLMSSERSGSNLITKLLNGHYNVCGPSTKHLINPVARNLFRYGDLTEETNWTELLADIERLFNANFSTWATNLDVPTLRMLSAPGDVGALIQNIFLREAREKSKQHVFVKENHVYEFFPFLEANFPSARYVYLVRDPRDMALSWKSNKDHPGGVVKAARQWRHDQVQSLKNYELLNRSGRVYRISYEDLIKSPEEKCRSICQSLGIPFDYNMIHFFEDDLTQRNAQQIGAWSNLAKPVIGDNAKKYRAQLDEREIAAVESICHYEMVHLGYQLEIIHDEPAAIDDTELREMEMIEERTNMREPQPGVAENMEAKKRFYRR